MPKVSLNTQSPEFSLKDFCGEEFSLKDLRESKNVLLVFNRGFM
jgi:peroxiredoxin